MDTGRGYFQQLQDDAILEKVKEVTEKVSLPTAATKMPLPTITEAWKKYPKHGGVFYVGQNLTINDSKFRVLAITKKTMTLRLLPREG